MRASRLSFAVKRVVIMLGTMALPSASPANSFTLSGGLDARAAAGSLGTEARLEGLFLNVRAVIVHKDADRWILVLQTDSGDNFKDPHLYQTYVQLKGPLGRWNVRAGRYLVPFGLLSSYDTERVILRSIEPLSLGLKLDEGIQVLGFTRNFDYAVSVTDGVRERNPVVTARVGKERGDTGFGVSVLAGRLPETASKESVELPGRVLDGVPMVRKVRLGFDLTRTSGPRLWRSEFTAGTDDGQAVGGGYAEVEQALSPKWTLNLNAGLWRGTEPRWRVGAGAARNLGRGHVIRGGALYRSEREERGHELVLQYYWEFSRQR